MFGGAHAFKGCAKRWNQLRMAREFVALLMYGPRSRRAAEHGMFNHWLIQLARVTHPQNRGGEIGSLKLCKTVQEIFGMFLGLESVGFTKNSPKTALLGRICSCVAHDSDVDHPRANDFMMFFLPMFIWQGEQEERRQVFFSFFSTDFFWVHRMMLHVAWHLRLKSGVWKCFPVPGRLFFRQGPKPSDSAVSKMLQKPPNSGRFLWTLIVC